MPDPIPLPHPVAFALSGGSSLGALHVGMMRALRERGVLPDLLVGSSAGAINAAFMGGGFTADRLDALAAVWARVRLADVFGAPGLTRLLSALGGGGALATPARLRSLLERHLPARHVDLAIPTAVIATDLRSGEPVVLEDGDLRRDVMASAAIPGLLPAVGIGGRVLADGGLAAQVPVLQAIALGAASVVVLDTGFPCALAELPRGLVQSLLHAASVVLRHQSEAALTSVGERATVLYLPSPCPLGVAPWDFTQADGLIARGYESSARFLEKVRSPCPGVHGHPHIHPGGRCERSAEGARGLTAMEAAPST